jgi:hypothetical protein
LLCLQKYPHVRTDNTCTWCRLIRILSPEPLIRRHAYFSDFVHLWSATEQAYCRSHWLRVYRRYKSSVFNDSQAATKVSSTGKWKMNSEITNEIGANVTHFQATCTNLSFPENNLFCIRDPTATCMNHVNVRQIVHGVSPVRCPLATAKIQSWCECNCTSL